MIKTIADTIIYLAHERYDANPKLYHNDFKIALYGIMIEVQLELIKVLRGIGK